MAIPIQLIVVAVAALVAAIGFLFRQILDTRQRLTMCEAETKSLKERTDSFVETEKSVARMTEAVENVDKRLDRIERLLDELNKKR